MFILDRINWSMDLLSQIAYILGMTFAFIALLMMALSAVILLGNFVLEEITYHTKENNHEHSDRSV